MKIIYLGKGKGQKKRSVKSKNCGYIIWKDSHAVIFYTNDLSQMPKNNVVNGSEQHARDCVCGLSNLRRWTGTET